MRLRFSPQAYADIVDIHEYIAQHNRRAATAVVAQIRITSLLLARYPSLGRETDIPSVRVFPTARYPYLVYHKVRQNELFVIHVRHGRRDAPTADELERARESDG
ncbi:MAG: type II toxin-antitoxin system RelE/ParE family toxin [Xanthobacteraceae bacterium]|nr:type II toxin-antitoxin system RelE/ParE family toxin [Xanthobacteraceae bacterium]